MKTRILSFFLILLAGLVALPPLAFSDGFPEEVRRPHRAKKAVEEVPPPPPEPTCVPRSRSPKVRIASWNPDQKITKFLGEITECVTTMWDVLKLLPGPNVINVEYPSEKEQWVYFWLWSYKLQNPIEDTVIMMDDEGKRIHRGKNPVELYLVFNEDDVVEKVEMNLVKGGNDGFR